MDELDACRCACLVLDKWPDPDGHVQERLVDLAGDPDGDAAWREIAAVMAVLGADAPAAGQRFQ